MASDVYRIALYLPAQGATETEATIVQWHVGVGDAFSKGQVLAQVDSAKSVFDFEAPCEGRVVGIPHPAGETVSYETPVLEIETSDPAMKDWIPPAVSASETEAAPRAIPAMAKPNERAAECSIIGLGAYLPSRIVSNAELVADFPGISEEYVYQVTGVRQRHWVSDTEKPSDLAFAASVKAIREAQISPGDIDAVILATTTPDVAMPSTACILQQRLGLRPGPAFDLNAACSGWLYAISMANAMIGSGMARNVLTVGVDVQSRLLDRTDHTTCFLFGDGAGAAIVSAGGHGHRVCRTLLGADASGLHMARREEPGYIVSNGSGNYDPWVRMDGQALFRFAAESFATLIRDAARMSGWTEGEARWIIPHQANARILKVAAKRCNVSYDRFYMNVDRVGNTSSASIPLAMAEVQETLARGDKLILCSVGAGITTAAVTIEW